MYDSVALPMEAQLITPCVAEFYHIALLMSHTGEVGSIFHVHGLGQEWPFFAQNGVPVNLPEERMGFYFFNPRALVRAAGKEGMRQHSSC